MSLICQIFSTNYLPTSGLVSQKACHCWLVVRCPKMSQAHLARAFKCSTSALSLVRGLKWMAWQCAKNDRQWPACQISNPGLLDQPWPTPQSTEMTRCGWRQRDFDPRCPKTTLGLTRAWGILKGLTLDWPIASWSLKATCWPFEVALHQSQCISIVVTSICPKNSTTHDLSIKFVKCQEDFWSSSIGTPTNSHGCHGTRSCKASWLSCVVWRRVLLGKLWLSGYQGWSSDVESNWEKCLTKSDVFFRFDISVQCLNMCIYIYTYQKQMRTDWWLTSKI